MKGYHVYSKIQQLRSAGFSQRQVARRLGINRKTVKRYWEMPVNEYEEMSSAICRMQYLDKYQKQIVNWLQEFPDMIAELDRARVEELVMEINEIAIRV